MLARLAGEHRPQAVDVMLERLAGIGFVVMAGHALFAEVRVHEAREIEALGAENILIGQIAGEGGTGDKPLEIAARLGRNFTAPIGSTVELYVDALPMHLFDPETEQVIARPALTGGA